jgi:flagellar biosynthesis anti-sigma factor FlgM
MSIRVQPGQPEVDLSSSTSLSSAKSGHTSGAASQASSAYSDLNALADAEDTASISSVPGQLSGDLPIRQDRVDALRAQIEAGTYTVNAHAVANAMFQNLFRS